MRFLPLLALLTVCQGDESLTAYGAADRVWRLQSINDTATTADITLTFPAPGEIAGQAPCNSYTGAQTVPYPWFKAENIATTRTTCPDQDVEAAYLAALQSMTLSEVAGALLVLSNDAGDTLSFTTD